MFFRLLLESFRRQRRRKLLAGVAILLGATAVTAMLALATTIGDRIHSELAVFGANIVVTHKSANLDVKIGGADIRPATSGWCQNAWRCAAASCAAAAYTGWPQNGHAWARPRWRVRRG